MASTLIIVQFVLAIVITIAILLQKSSSMGLGAYSGSNDSMFGAKGPANFLTKFTFIIGFGLVLNTLVLGYIYNEQQQKSVVDDVQINKLVPAVPQAPLKKAADTTKAPAAPTSK